MGPLEQSSHLSCPDVSTRRREEPSNMAELRLQQRCQRAIGSGPQSGCCQSTIPTDREETTSSPLLFTGVPTQPMMPGGAPTSRELLFTLPTPSPNTPSVSNGPRSIFSPTSTPVSFKSPTPTLTSLYGSVEDSLYPTATELVSKIHGAKPAATKLPSTRNSTSSSTSPLEVPTVGLRMERVASHGSMVPQLPRGISGLNAMSGTQRGRRKELARWRSARSRCGSSVMGMRTNRLLSH